MPRRLLTDFNSPTPREVPFSVRLRVIFGGFANQFGWLFFGFGMIFVWAFALQADVTSWFLFRLPTNVTAGVVERTDSSNASENDVQIYEVGYTFFDQLGRQQTGTSYTAGSPNVGGRVSVEYVRSIPSISRVSGMRRKPFGGWAVFPVIFPLIGLAFMVSGIREGLKANRLLHMGRIAFGKLTSTEYTSTSINDRPVLKLTFTFTDRAGEEWETIAKTHQPEDLRDDEEEPLLYDPDSPEIAVLLDNLPGKTEFDDHGRLIPAGPIETGKLLVIPGLSIVGHGMFLLLNLF